LGYSESCAYRRISAVKIIRQLPEIKEKLNSGAINLTNLTMAQSLFAKIETTNQSKKCSIQSKKEILAQIENCTKIQAEKILATHGESVGVTLTTYRSESVRTVSGDQASLHVRVPSETVRSLDRIRELRAHKKPNMSYGDVITDMCGIVLRKIDHAKSKIDEAKQKIEHAKNKIEDTKNRISDILQLKQADNKNTSNPRLGRIPLAIELRRQIWKRDRGQCTFTSNETGKRCESRHLLQIDHEHPVFMGGETKLENLRLLCHSHHKLREEEFN
jgi:hypothetical protein